jgi:hypothetical protein
MGGVGIGGGWRPMEEEDEEPDKFVFDFFKNKSLGNANRSYSNIYSNNSFIFSFS